ncbi:MAG: hypothetical protein V4689_22590 [Verrucomicrobiota bacterium]
MNRANPQRMARGMMEKIEHARAGPVWIQPKRNTNITMNALEIEQNWNIGRGRLNQKWTNVAAEDWTYAAAKGEELAGRIQMRSRQTWEAIEKELADSCDCGC